MLSQKDFGRMSMLMMCDLKETKRNVTKRLEQTKKFLTNKNLYHIKKDFYVAGDEIENLIIILNPKEKINSYVQDTIDGFNGLSFNEKECLFYVLCMGKTKSQLKSGIWINDNYVKISNIYAIWNKLLDKLIFAYSEEFVY